MNIILLMTKMTLLLILVIRSGSDSIESLSYPQKKIRSSADFFYSVGPSQLEKPPTKLKVFSKPNCSMALQAFTLRTPAAQYT